MFFHYIYHSPLGEIRLLADQYALLKLSFKGQAFPELSGSMRSVSVKESSVLKATADWLDAYFAGKKPSISVLPLAPQGSAFRQSVWELLLQIPYGEVRTYGDIAKEIGAKRGIAKMASQAIGGAVGHNPIPIIIPCHRVIGSNGNLTGYGGGIDLKIKLLVHEGVDVTKLSMPKRRIR